MIGWQKADWDAYEQEEKAYKARMRKFFETENGRKCRYIKGSLHNLFRDNFSGIKPVLYQKIYDGLTEWIKPLVASKSEEERLALKNSFEKNLVNICESFERDVYYSEEMFLQKIIRILKDCDCEIKIDESRFKTLEDLKYIQSIDDSIRDF